MGLGAPHEKMQKVQQQEDHRAETLVWEKRDMRHVRLRAWFKADGVLEVKK